MESAAMQALNHMTFIIIMKIIKRFESCNLSYVAVWGGDIFADDELDDPEIRNFIFFTFCNEPGAKPGAYFAGLW